MIMCGPTQYSQTRCSNTPGKSLVAAPQNLKREIRKENQFVKFVTQHRGPPKKDPIMYFFNDCLEYIFND